MLTIKHHGWWRKELTHVEKAGIITSSISNFPSPIITVPMKKDPSTCEITCRMAVDLMRLMIPLMRMERIFSKHHGAKSSSM